MVKPNLSDFFRILSLVVILNTFTISLYAQQALTFQTRQGVETGLVNEVVAYDAGYFVLMSSVTNSGDQELYISKFDNCHTQLWSKSYASDTPLDFNKAVVDEDRLVILAGTDMDYPVVIFLDLEGFLLFIRSYNKGVFNNPNVIQAHNGQYHLFGAADMGPQHIILDNNGAVISASILVGGSSNAVTGNNPFGGGVLEDGSYVRRKANVLACFDTAGDIIWAKAYELSNFGFSENEIIPVSGGFIIMMESSDGENAVVRLDMNGDIVWESATLGVIHSTASLELHDGIVSVVTLTKDIARDLVLIQVDAITGDLLSSNVFEFPEFNDYRFPEHAISSRGDIIISGSVLVSSSNGDSEDLVQINPQRSSCHEVNNYATSARPSLNYFDITNDVTTISSNVLEDIQPLITSDQPLFFEEKCSLPILVEIDTIVNCTGEYYFETSHPGATYNWSDGVMDSVRLFTDPGTFSLVVEGCGISLQYEVRVQQAVNNLIADAGDDVILTCEQGSVNLEGGASSSGMNIVYSWQTDDGNIVQGAETTTPQVDQIGTYVLELYDSALDCSTRDTVIVIADMDLPVSDAGPDQNLTCTSPVLNLGGNSSSGTDFIYSWDSNGMEISTQSSYSTTMDGIFELTVVNTVNGCIDMDTVIVTADLEAPSDLLVDNLAVDCLTGSIEVTEVVDGVGPFTFALDGGLPQESGLFIALSPGLHTIQVEGSNGCIYEEVFDVEVASSFSLDLGMELSISPGESVQLVVNTDIDTAEIFSVSWSEEETLDCGDCLEPIAQPTATTTYEVTVTSTEGCVETTAIRVVVELDPLKIYVPEIFAPYTGMGADAQFTIYTDQQVVAVAFLNIYDRWGNLVFSNSDFLPNEASQGWNGYVKDRKVDSGVYVFSYGLELIDGSTYEDAGALTLLR